MLLDATRSACIWTLYYNEAIFQSDTGPGSKEAFFAFPQRKTAPAEVKHRVAAFSGKIIWRSDIRERLASGVLRQVVYCIRPDCLGNYDLINKYEGIETTR